ncbi:MAG TPA: hypothetical protein VG899_12575 [Mycobacteriales bacterium]|nr:hypothetical protein [Mycobacteriales bacterium]
MSLLLAGGGVASALTVGTDRIAAAARLVGDARVGDKAEAWYASPSGALCLPLVGCVPVPVSLPAYPAGTLHVGVTLGLTSTRSYVVPDLPSSATALPASGTLMVPVDSSPQAGTFDLGSARIKACLTTGQPPSQSSAKSESTGAAPTVDCAVSAPARYDAEIHAFRVDLTPFLAKWRHGRPERGIALLPAAGGAALADWQVALDGKGAAATSIYSLFATTSPHQAAPTPSTSPSTTATVPPTAVVPPGPGVALPGIGEVSPESSPPAIAAPVQPAVYFVRSTRFRYPAIFIAPLAILAGVVFFARLFTGTTTRPRNKMTVHRIENGS